MPKQLDNLELKIVNAGRKLLFSEGYSAFSMRKVAKDCDIAVGTIYNYFSNKDELIASIAASDWYSVEKEIEERIDENAGFSENILVIYKAIKSFRKTYSASFMSYASQVNSKNAIESYHPFLRSSISKYIDKVLSDCDEEKRNSLVILSSELVITCATHDDIKEDDIKKFFNAIDIH